MAFVRQVRAELRKAWHPLLAVTLVVGAAVSALLQQLSNGLAPYPGPSIVDVTGCLRIAALQHDTTIGFAIAAVAAGVGTADEASTGALREALLFEPRRRRLFAVKSVAVALILAFSLVLTAATLWVCGLIAPVRRDSPSSIQRTSSVTSALVDLARSVPVVCLIAVIVVGLALLLRSVIATLAASVALFVLPLTVLELPVMWLTPSRWIVEWLHLEPFGEGVDYLAVNSPFDRWGRPALASGAAIVTLTLTILTVGSTRLISNAIKAPANSA